MKLYFPSNLYNPVFRGKVFPILKPFLKGANFTDAQRQDLYGLSAIDFIVVESMKEAEVVVLPMSWNYYAQSKQLNAAYALITEANQANKMVWSINAGDFGVKLPYFQNLIVFRQGGYVSNEQKGHQGHPSFIEDYLIKHHLEKSFLNSIYKKQPLVGFCGQTNLSKWHALKEMFKQQVRNMNSIIGFSYLEPQKTLSTSYLRASLLKNLESNTQIANQFIKRDKYRAGVTKNKETDNTTAEFYNNILESQYVLCVRGAGNFSVRFYETLMMGRIPLYVHTDGYLPLSDTIDWKEHVVWVDYKDRHQISDILLKFHQQLDQERLMALFKKNRKLWEEKLTLSGFFEAQSNKLSK